MHLAHSCYGMRTRFRDIRKNSGIRMKTLKNLALLGLTTGCWMVLTYAGCVIWPLQMRPADAIIAAIGAGLCWGAVFSIFLSFASNPPE